MNDRPSPSPSQHLPANVVPSIRVDATSGDLSLAPGTTITTQGPHPSPWLQFVAQLDAIVAIGAFAYLAREGAIDSQTAGAFIVETIVAALRGVGASTVLTQGGGIVTSALGALAAARARNKGDKP